MLEPSILVACGISAVASAIFAVVAWVNSQPHVLQQLRNEMQALEADRVAWLQRMDTFADAAQHDLEQAGEQRRKAQNAANRSKGRQADNGGGLPESGAPVNEEDLLAATAEYWKSR